MQYQFISTLFFINSLIVWRNNLNAIISKIIKRKVITIPDTSGD